MFIIWGNDNLNKISGKLEQVHWPLLENWHGMALQGPQKLIYRLVRQFFSDNSRTTEGMSTGKTLHERFSSNLSDRSNSKLCLHLKFLRKSDFLLCFLPFWERFWWCIKKFLVAILAFLQWLYLASSAFKDYTKSHAIVSGLGKNNIAAKKAIWKKATF